MRFTGSARCVTQPSTIDRAHYLLLYRCNNNYSSPALVPINPSRDVVAIIATSKYIYIYIQQHHLSHHHLHLFRTMSWVLFPYVLSILSIGLVVAHLLNSCMNQRRGRQREGFYCPILFRLIVVARIIGQCRLFKTKPSARPTKALMSNNWSTRLCARINTIRNCVMCIIFGNQ